MTLPVQICMYCILVDRSKGITAHQKHAIWLLIGCFYALCMNIWRLMYLLLQFDTQIQTSSVPDACNFSPPSQLHQASHYRPRLRGVMYPGQVLRPAVYSGPLGTYRTGPTLFVCVIVPEGFPWIKCCRVQTQQSQRTPSWCSMSVMGDEAVHTLFLP